VIDAAEVYDAYLDRVYAFLAYRVRSTADAEDLTSATFERVVRSASRFDPDLGSLATWVFAIAERVLIDHYRKQARRDEQLLNEDSALGAGIEDQHAIGIAPELQHALSRLSERDRCVIGLRFGGDLSGKEIAQIVGLSDANVHQVLSRALRALRAELEKSGAGGSRR